MPLRQAIVVGAVDATSPWLADLRASLAGCRWPVDVHVTRDWELHSIGYGALRWDEFVFLPESTIVRDLDVFERCFVEHAGRSVNLGTAQGLRFRMYLGKYRAAAVGTLGVPWVGGKGEAIQQEVTWCTAYAEAEAAAGLLADVGGPMEHTDVREDRHGRVNMVVGNEYLVRYKGTWG